MDVRPYDSPRDRAAAARIWQEAGWLGDGKDPELIDLFLTAGPALVAELHGRPECIAASVPGRMHYLNETLRLSAVTAVLTGRPARRQGLAGRLTAQLVAAGAARGAHVSALGMFEQGFYDRLGFGTGAYEHLIGFDPTRLRTTARPRVPRRLSAADWQQVHDAMLRHRPGHGACVLDAAAHTRAEMALTPNLFGLGYGDGPEGALTHGFWGKTRGEHGPYTINALIYRTHAQLTELLALIHTLGDQVRLVQMREPRHVQMQDLLVRPLSSWQVARGSEFPRRIEAAAWWQARILDLEGCLARTHLPRPATRFNLELHDPISKRLDPDAPWRGIAGAYTVTLGPESAAVRGHDPVLPTLTASAGAFTRLWLGVRPASGLALTDDLSGPSDLLHALDDTLCLPTPIPNWDF